MKDLPHTRRQFLATSGAVGLAAPVVTAFGMQLAAFNSAASQSATGYKALVCIFQLGGNDANNTVLATDTDSWNRYWAARNTGADPIALMPPGTAAAAVGSTSPVTGRTVTAASPEAWGGVLPITPRTAQPIPAGTNATSRTFAFHPMLAPLIPVYTAGRLAVIANVGTLVEPVTKTEYSARAKKVPANLFSHNDQQAVWQAGLTEGVRTGWGGQFGDLMASGNGANSLYTAMSTAGNAVFLSGRSVVQYQVSTGATPAVAVNAVGGASLFGSSQGPAKMREIIRDTGFVANMGADHATIVGRSLDASVTLNAAAAGTIVTAIPAPPVYRNPITNNVETNSLSVQLQTVARMIAAAPALGLRRQVFFVAIGGHDSHDFQNTAQPNNLSKLATAMATFDATLANIGGVDMRSAVTTFTASDFSRTFNTNGDGTDHAWGGHHLIMGGAVNGGDIYGQFPTVGTDLGSFRNPDQTGNAHIPTTSVDQYAATLGSWFGVSNTDLGVIFPNLRNFSRPNLGFMI
ncbi:hypothetical protein PbB2_00481 [Candidatus Phycosocius bacilliformis]|uniref:DUF1501 domain-containing protein n=1 Tax=Candidatus Phycosocius bacilliformis TaxID=1445552 RepID=A0A2P2E6Z0_9PROT|nr:DUF1501 domain-containing protein [Candidatus Phycosocius bacilliformis]GBF56824.1 hypothetical protein PbB2_00481 [Candidatus Phycosocius bacilliformis]